MRDQLKPKINSRDKHAIKLYDFSYDLFEQEKQLTLFLHWTDMVKGGWVKKHILRNVGARKLTMMTILMMYKG